MRGARILVLDPDTSQRRATSEGLSAHGFYVEVPESLEIAAERLSKGSYGILIVDLDILGEDWAAGLSQLKQKAPETEVIVTASQGSIEAAVEAIREGAYDYLLKPLDLGRLPVLVDRALEKRRLAEENRNLRERLSLKDEVGNVVGKSSPISKVYEVVAQVAGTNAAVLLTGESGTGKELIAKGNLRRLLGEVNIE